MTLTVKDGATWTPTAIQNTTDQKYASLNNLILDNGNIDVNKGVEIAIDKVTGTGFLANEGTVTLTSGALEGRTENAGIINLDPGASISNVTIEQGDANPSAALIAVEADRTTLNGGMATGENATASVAGVAVDTNKNVMITSVDFKNNTFTADRNYPIIGAVTANLDAEQSLTITGSTFANNTVALTGTGSSGGSGGAAVSVKGQGENSQLTILDSTFSGNKAEGAAGQGGAIYNAGTLTVSGGEFTGNEAGKYGGAIAGDVEGQGSLNITNATFTGNTSGAGGAIALWSDSIKDAADHAITARFEGNTAERKGGAIVFLANHSGDKTVNASISGEFLNNSAGESGGAIHSERATLTITDATFTGNHATQQGGAIYNAANSSISFSGTNTFTDNTAAEGNDIYNAGSITVADGTTTLGSGLTQVGGKVTVSTGATLDMASGSSLSFEGDNTALTIDGGTFVADFGQLLTDYATTNTDNGIKDSSIIGQSGNLNLRLDGVDYTLDEYNAAKNALLGQNDVTENATLNFLNANLKLDEGQNLVVGATVADNEVTIEMAPVVADAAESPIEAADDGTITSVPNQIVSVVAADDSAKELLPADTITVSGSEFIAKGLQIASTASPEAEAVTLAVTDGSNVTLTGGEAGFTGVVNAENEAVATNVEVSNASLTVGLEGNDSAQNLTLNDVKVADGTFEVAGNGLDTTQVEASTLTPEKAAPLR